MRLAAFCRFSAQSSMMVIELAVCDSHSPHYREKRSVQSQRKKREERTKKQKKKIKRKLVNAQSLLINK
jgi:5-deoxy-D-glucuronate isomerase